MRKITALVLFCSFQRNYKSFLLSLFTLFLALTSQIQAQDTLVFNYEIGVQYRSDASGFGLGVVSNYKNIMLRLRLDYSIGLGNNQFNQPQIQVIVNEFEPHLYVDLGYKLRKHNVYLGYEVYSNSGFIDLNTLEVQHFHVLSPVYAYSMNKKMQVEIRGTIPLNKIIKSRDQNGNPQSYAIYPWAPISVGFNYRF